MSASAARPVRLSPEARARAERIFARLIGGQPVRAIAAAEALSVRRVQQIVREELDRRDSNPAEDYALMQIARLERALDLLGSQIDAGKPAAVHGFVRVLDHLNRLAPQGLRRRPAIIKQLGDADMMAERLVRLDAARESLALREAERKSQRPADEAKPNPPQVLENKGTGETADVAPSMISEA